MNSKEIKDLTHGLSVMRSKVPFLQKGVCYVTFAFELGLSIKLDQATESVKEQRLSELSCVEIAERRSTLIMIHPLYGSFNTVNKSISVNFLPRLKLSSQSLILVRVQSRTKLR